MNQKISEVFKDQKLVVKIQNKLPKLFQIADLECSRAGKIGMEVGSVREKIIIALLILKFGEKSVETEIPITEAEIDVKVNNKPISIKTVTGMTPTGIKLIWTVDAEKAMKFREKYTPPCDMILVQINWSNGGGLYYITKETQVEVLKALGREKYIKLPKAGTNPRGVEMTKEAVQNLLQHRTTLSIPINWKREATNYQPHKRWIELWEQE